MIAAVLMAPTEKEIAYEAGDVAEEVAEVTHGCGVDAVINAVGCERFAEHLAALGRDGRLATCEAHGGATVEVNLAKLYNPGHRILGFGRASPDELTSALRMVLDGEIGV